METVADGLIGAIGKTPLIRLKRASAATGCDDSGQGGVLNPGGSVKDRAGLAIIRRCRGARQAQAGRHIVEGTAGNTGIGLTLVGQRAGLNSVIVMPETQSRRKRSTSCA